MSAAAAPSRSQTTSRVGVAIVTAAVALAIAVVTRASVIATAAHAVAGVEADSRGQAGTSAARITTPVTFTRDIAPLVFERCVLCHHPTGTAPFSLQTYAQVRQHARQIGEVTKRRYMPPWPATSTFGAFIGQHPLSDEEIDLIQRWVDAGAPEGDPLDLPPQPAVPGGWHLGKPDLIVTFPEPYQLSGEGSDVFRIFVVRVPLGKPTFVRGLEFLPGNPRVVHHANIRLDRTPASREQDERDSVPGYEGLILRSATYPDGHFLGWTPGQIAPITPPELAWRLEPGSDLVIELHMQPSGKPELVRPSIGLFFGEAAPTRTPLMLRLGRQNIDIPVGARDHQVADSFVLPVDVEVHAIQPHSHSRATQVDGTATLPDGSTKSLISIPRWDFRWQHVYRFTQPYLLPKGTRLSMDYRFDNSAENPRNPFQPPRRARWGQRSSDEMGDLWIQVLPKNASDLATLIEAFRPKVLSEDAVGYERVLEEDPNNESLHNDLALLYMDLGRSDKAVEHFRRSVEIHPALASTHFNLGTALTMAGRVAESVEEFERALALRPDYATAHNNLANAHLMMGRVDEAIRHYRETLRLEPTHALAHNNLGRALLSRESDPAEAISHLRQALTLQPGYAEAHYNLGVALLGRAPDVEVEQHLRQALAIRPEWPAAMADLAWLLATAASEASRRPAEAVTLAQRVADVTKSQDWRALDVLAAALASSGRFDDAAATAERALALEPPAAAAAATRARLALYREGRPFRLPAGSK